jgi:hypothetical protein
MRARAAQRLALGPHFGGMSAIFRNSIQMEDPK